MRNEVKPGRKKPGRKKHFPERMDATLRAGSLQAMDDLRYEGESRTDFIRAAVDREIERRSQ